MTDPKDKVKQDLIDKGISAEDAQYIIDHGWVENSAGKEYVLIREIPSNHYAVIGVVFGDDDYADRFPEDVPWDSLDPDDEESYRAWEAVAMALLEEQLIPEVVADFVETADVNYPFITARRKLYLEEAQSLGPANLGHHWAYCPEWTILDMEGHDEVYERDEYVLDAQVTLRDVDTSQFLVMLFGGYAKTECELPLAPNRPLSFFITDPEGNRNGPFEGNTGPYWMS
jgi:hypothetical protein